jgi:hypothetical protein
MLISSCDDGTAKSQMMMRGTDEFGNSVMESDGFRTVFAKNLPAKVTYNDTNFSISDAAAYEIISDYNHVLYVVFELDLSPLSEEERHWLIEEDLSSHVSVTSEKNGVERESTILLGRLIDGDNLYCVYMSDVLDKYRYSFASSEITVIVDVKQEATHEYVGTDGQKSQLKNLETVMYTFTTDETMKSAEEIEQPLHDYITDWLYEKAEKYK